jgi:hypothetical protein
MGKTDSKNKKVTKSRVTKSRVTKHYSFDESAKNTEKTRTASKTRKRKTSSSKNQSSPSSSLSPILEVSHHKRISYPTSYPTIINYDYKSETQTIINRHIIIVPKPNPPESWICDHILFYRSSSTSNEGYDTKGTWLPLLDVVSEQNKKTYFTLAGNDETQKRNLEQQIYFLKIQFFTEFISKLFASKTRGSPLRFYSIVKMFEEYLKFELTNELIDLVPNITFKNKTKNEEETSTTTKFNYDYSIDSEFSNLNLEILQSILKKVLDFDNKIQKLWKTIYTYFSDVWQIIYSVQLDKNGELWIHNPGFVDFLTSREEYKHYTIHEANVESILTIDVNPADKLIIDNEMVTDVNKFIENNNRKTIEFIDSHSNCSITEDSFRTFVHGYEDQMVLFNRGSFLREFLTSLRKKIAIQNAKSKYVK